MRGACRRPRPDVGERDAARPALHDDVLDAARDRGEDGDTGRRGSAARSSRRPPGGSARRDPRRRTPSRCRARGAVRPAAAARLPMLYAMPNERPGVATAYSPSHGSGASPSTRKAPTGVAARSAPRGGPPRSRRASPAPARRPPARASGEHGRGGGHHVLAAAVLEAHPDAVVRLLHERRSRAAPDLRRRARETLDHGRRPADDAAREPGRPVPHEVEVATPYPAASSSGSPLERVSVQRNIASTSGGSGPMCWLKDSSSMKLTTRAVRAPPRTRRGAA